MNNKNDEGEEPPLPEEFLYESEQRLLEFTRVDRHTWHFQAEPIGYRVEMLNHPLDCSCALTICRETKICSLLYCCTCDDFVFGNKICDHIVYVDTSLKQHNVTFIQKNAEQNCPSTEKTTRLAKYDKLDFFPYKDYFSTLENFDLQLLQGEHYYYWFGLEDIIRRHEMVELIDDIQYDAILETWTLSETFGKNVSMTIVKKNPVKCKKCPLYKICNQCGCCRHLFVCMCMDYKSGFFCRHSHAVAVKVERKFRKCNDISQSFAYRHDIVRNFLLYPHNRIRHNVGRGLQTVALTEHTFLVNDDIQFDYIAIVRKLPKMVCGCSWSRRCLSCEACIHEYACKCQDYVRGFICIHIHAVKLLYSRLRKMILNEICISVLNENENRIQIPKKFDWLDSNILSGRILADEEYKKKYAKLYFELNESASVLPTKNFFSLHLTLNLPSIGDFGYDELYNDRNLGDYIVETLSRRCSSYLPGDSMGAMSSSSEQSLGESLNVDLRSCEARRRNNSDNSERETKKNKFGKR